MHLHNCIKSPEEGVVFSDVAAGFHQMWVLGTKLVLLERTARVLNHKTIFILKYGNKLRKAFV